MEKERQKQKKRQTNKYLLQKYFIRFKKAYNCISTLRKKHVSGVPLGLGTWGRVHTKFLQPP